MRTSRLLTGAAAGVIATLPMTLIMLALRSWLPRHEQRRLPPEQITAHLTRRTGLRRIFDRRNDGVLAWVLHFAFGGSAGSIYGVLSAGVPLPKWLMGSLFGSLVWVGSYFGWLPILRIHGNGHEQSRRRNALMLVAHVVWGVTLGPLRQLLAGSPPSLPGDRSA
jgi:uncharacterized membrane protein YagU involved in acid resistance